MGLRLNGTLRGKNEKSVLLGNGSSSKVVSTSLLILFEIRECAIFKIKEDEIFSDDDIKELVDICYDERFNHQEDLHLLEPKLEKKTREKAMKNEDVTLQKELLNKLKKLKISDKMLIFPLFSNLKGNPFTEIFEDDFDLSLKYYILYLQKMFTKNIKNEIKDYDKVYKNLLIKLKLDLD